MIETGDLAGALLQISDSVQSTGRVIGREVLWSRSGAETPAAGDVYMVAPPVWRVGLLLIGLREALESWGDVETVATLGTGDGETTTWSLPVGVSGMITRVFITTEEGDQRDEWHLWEPTTSGVELTGTVKEGDVITAVVRYAAVDDFTMPPSTSTLDDALQVPREFIGWRGAFACFRSAVGVPGQDQDNMVQLMNYAAEQAERARMQAGELPARSRERLFR
jgi:hypothetical protein